MNSISVRQLASMFQDLPSADNHMDDIIRKMVVRDVVGYLGHTSEPCNEKVPIVTFRKVKRHPDGSGLNYQWEIYAA